MKKINKPRIIERLRIRFALTDIEKELFTLLENVILVTNVDDLLKQWRVYAGTASKTHASGSGDVLIFTCQTGKKASVRAVHLLRTAGDMTINIISVIIDVIGMAIYTQTAASGLSTGILNQDICLKEGDTLWVYAVAVSADTTWSVRVLYEEEDAF